MKKLNIIAYIALLINCACQKKESDPSLTTISATPTSVYTCTAIAKVNSLGSYNILDHGFVFYYSNADNLYNVNMSNSVSLGKMIAKDTFASNIILPENNYSYTNYKWYIRGYITNEKGIIYGNSASFFPLTPSLLSVYPTTAKIGDTVTITGNNFDLNPINDVVQFNSYSNYTAKVIACSKTTLTVIVPDFTSGYYYGGSVSISVTIGNQTYTLNNAFTPAFSVTGFNPNNGTFGTTINILGYYLNNVSSVLLGNVSVSFYTSSSSDIILNVPSNITSQKFNIYVINGNTKNQVPGGYFIMNNLTTSSITPAMVIPGTLITINGTNFNNVLNYNKIYIGSTMIYANSYGDANNFINANLPTTITGGSYKVSVSNGLDSVTVPGNLTVVIPTITGISPTSGSWGTNLTITGHNFNMNGGYILFNENYCYPNSYDSTSYNINVPSTLLPGTYQVNIMNNSYQIISSLNFTLLPPTLTSLTPSSGSAGTSVIISGQGFRSNTNNVYVSFGNLVAQVTAVNNTEINVNVPSGVTSGAYLVSVTVNNYTITNSLTFTAP